VHAEAYALLLAIGDLARREPELLSAQSEAAITKTETCLAYLATHRDVLPHALLPRSKDARAFAAMLGSFFHTSFHVQRLEWNGKLIDATLVRGPAIDGTRADKRRRHGGDPAREALHRLCRDEGLRVPEARLAKLAHARSMTMEVTVWTYAVSLVERSRGRSEGWFDVRLFQGIKRRTSLDEHVVWAARSRLVEVLTTLAKE
jgi:hypothetical protein